MSIGAAAQVTYTLTYNDSSTSVIKISIEPSTFLTAPVSFVMSRSIPGAYSICVYDHFIEHLVAINSKGKKIAMLKDQNDAPRWYCNDSSSPIIRLEYEVNIKKMEMKMAPSDASVVRQGFAGILNYSVFGWIDGLEKRPVKCVIETFDQWPVYTTLAPAAALKKGGLVFNADNYFTLADGQIFIGPRFRVKAFEGIVPLYVVSYSQTEDEYLDDYGRQGISSMGILLDYFGELPFKQYSIMLSKALPLETGSAPALGMEHLQSATFFGDSSGLRRSAMSKEDLINTMPTFLHHMGHSLLPLRCYGDRYHPYVSEIPSIISNIWFNEGFMWFLPYDTLQLQRMMDNFNNSVYHTAPAIKSLSLQQLSQLASTTYGTDFRIGRSVYSRGALMALEMDHYLKEKSGGKKSMKDVFHYLYQWAKQQQRPFTMEEFPLLLNQACNINLDAIYEKWQLPIK
jgi:predicted metalloprotease with PDZ domain